jgi:RNA 2',3'-cyclic 3'-phosphodiesterase
MRLFVAIDIDNATRSQLTTAREAIESALTTAVVLPKITWQRPEAAHVTLRFIGEVSEAVAARLQQTLSTALPLSAFDVQWNHVGAFPNERRPRVLWVGPAAVEPLSTLAAIVNERLSAFVPADDDRPFRPHLTIGRLRTEARGVRWPDILRAASWQPTVTHVSRVTLYMSRLSPKGSTYTALATATLDG